jgi:hypothetical protein
MYHFRLLRTDGSPADPPTYRSSALNWRLDDTIPFNAEQTFACSASGRDSTEDTTRHSPEGSDESEWVRHSLRSEAKSERRTQ